MTGRPTRALEDRDVQGRGPRWCSRELKLLQHQGLTGVSRGQTPHCAPRTAVGVRWGAGGASGKQTFTSHDIVIYLFVCTADPVSLSAGKRTWAGSPGNRPQERAHPERRGAAVGQPWGLLRCRRSC